MASERLILAASRSYVILFLYILWAFSTKQLSHSNTEYEIVMTNSYLTRARGITVHCGVNDIGFVNIRETSNIPRPHET